MRLLLAAVAIVSVLASVEAGSAFKEGVFCNGQSCHINAECINDECICGSGFSGDGFHCTVIRTSTALLPPECPLGMYDPLHDKTASVRTCEELAFQNDEGFPEVCGDSDHNDTLYNGFGVGDASCYPGGNWSEASCTCNSFGSRLCTITELLTQEAAHVGCGHDSTQIWSSTACTVPGTGAAGFYTSVGAPGIGEPAECRDMQLFADVNCCADSEEAKACKNCPVGYYCPDPNGGPIQCPTGYSSSGTNAISVSRCTLCADGFIETSPGVCTDENECNGEGSGHECDTGAGTCVNTAGSYHCTCPNEFEILVDGACTHIYETSFMSCSENGFQNNGEGDPDICGDSDPLGACSGRRVWNASQDFCNVLGGRLCSLAEAQANEAYDTGCGYDNNQLWTSTSCGPNSYWRIRGNVREGDEPTCELESNIVRSRCCANVLSNTTKSFRDDLAYRRYSVAPATSARSCSELGWSGDSSVCAISEVWDNCHINRQRSWVHAAHICALKGARLCTEEEVKNGASCDTGCNFDASFVWTSSECDTDGIPGNEFWSHRDGCNSEEIVVSDPICRTIDTLMNVPCCADVF